MAQDATFETVSS